MTDQPTNQNEPREWGYTTGAYIVLAVCSLVYLVSAFMAPQTSSSAAFQLSPTQQVLIQLSIIIPILIIWTVALGATLTFKNYAKIIEGSPEARGIDRIADGLLWLVIYLVLASVLGIVVRYFVGLPSLWLVVAIKNHLPVIASLVAFSLLYQGSLHLKAVAETKDWPNTPVWLIAGFSIFAGGLTWLFAVSPYDMSSLIPSYGLPQDINLYTMILPHILAWFIGLLAAINIFNYTRFVKGVIYHQALRRLVWGILAVIASAAILQLLTILSKIFSALTLAPFLLGIYALILCYGIGFMFIRSGAQKLTQIEVAQ